MRRWYVVHTKASKEENAAHHLRNQGFETYLPRYRKTRRHARKVDEVLRPLFPRYLFVRLDLEADRWHAVHGTIGVSRMIGGETPTAAPDGVVDAIKTREGPQGIVKLDPPSFRPGQKLCIKHGALADHVGIFEDRSDERRVILLLDLLGRKVRVTAPVEHLAAAS